MLLFNYSSRKSSTYAQLLTYAKSQKQRRLLVNTYNLNSTLHHPLHLTNSFILNKSTKLILFLLIPLTVFFGLYTSLILGDNSVRYYILIAELLKLNPIITEFITYSNL